MRRLPEEPVNARVAIEREDGAHIDEATVLEHAREDRIGVSRDVERLHVEIPEDPVKALRYAAHGRQGIARR
jgi:hypothetical protein